MIPAVLVYLGIYLVKIDISFSKILKAVVLAELVFVIPEILKLGWFSFNPVSMDALRSFHPLSLYSFFDPHQISLQALILQF